MSNYDQLLATIRDRVDSYEQERRTPPTDCPYDSTPLQYVNGVWHCPFDGYQWPRDGRGPLA